MLSVRYLNMYLRVYRYNLGVTVRTVLVPAPRGPRYDRLPLMRTKDTLVASEWRFLAAGREHNLLEVP